MEPKQPSLLVDLEVLRHLQGFPDELERYANLLKHAHPQGRSACGLIIQQQLLERLERGEVPMPEFRDGAKVIWRRDVWEERLRDGRGPA